MNIVKTLLITSVAAGIGFTSYHTAAEEAPPLTLPPLDAPGNRLSALPEMYVESFKLEGGTLFSEELEALLEPYTKRKISAEELQELRNKISQFYVEKGYINSGAVIPDQEVTDNIITLRIIEGRLNEIDVGGNKYLRAGYLQGRLRPNADEPLNTEKLQERLQILQQESLMKRFNAELGPGLRPGEATLKFDIEEKTPYSFGAEFNNHRSPNVGSYRLVLEGRHNSLTGWGDVLEARYGLTKGLKDYSLNYALPINRHDTKLRLRLENSDSEVVSEPFKELDVESEASTYSVGASHPFYRVYTKDFHYKVFEGGVALEKRRSKTFLLGEPFSFSAGVQDGESKLSVLRLTQNWLDRSRQRVIAFYSSFGIGLDMWNATIDDGLDEQGSSAEAPDGRFVNWQGQFRWIQRLPDIKFIKESQLWLRTDLQWSNDDLLPLEKFAIGGAATVRGYRENLLARDRGVALSAEWQIPLNEDSTLLLAPFVDFGGGWNVSLEETGPTTISSVGLGVLWQPKPYLRTELYWGHALKDVETPEDDDIQDDGIHFSVRLQLSDLLMKTP